MTRSQARMRGRLEGLESVQPRAMASLPQAKCDVDASGGESLEEDGCLSSCSWSWFEVSAVATHGMLEQQQGESEDGNESEDDNESGG